MPEKPEIQAGAERKDRILEAAVDVIGERGYAAASTAEIAKRAEVAEGTIFRHYKSKKGLLLAIVQPVFDRFIAPFATRSLKTVMTAEYDSVEAWLAALVDDRLALFDTMPRIARVFLQELSLHAEVRVPAEKIMREQVLPLFAGQIARLKEKGLVDPALPDASAMRMVMTTVGGWAILRYLIAPDHPWHDVEERAVMVRTLARGFAPPSR